VRVCIVTRVLPVHGIGGMQDHTIDLARGLVAAGHEVELITGRRPQGSTGEENGGIRVHYVDAPTNDFTNADWRNRSYELFLRLDGARAYDVVHSEGSSALELTRRGVQRRTPLVVMFHGNFLGLVKASLIRQRQARRLLAVLREQHGLIDLARRHFAKGNWRVFRECEAIVPSRQQFADTCRSHRLDPARVHIVPNGIDTSVFLPGHRDEARAALDLPGGFLFVCAGRLSRDKGLHHAVTALAHVDLAGARLLVVGGGEERGPLERLAAERGVSDRVTFAGPQAPELMPTFLSAADAFLFPTERDEAAPLILLQALACGLPVIATRRGGVTEVLDRPGENGLLVRSGDLGALVGEATRVYRDEHLRKSLAAGARARIREAYTLEQMVASTINVYEIAADRLAASRSSDPAE
jgi:glycosyltransferase involved in cell wall biosynthesis